MTRVSDVYPDDRVILREVGLAGRPATGEEVPVDGGEAALGP